MQICDVFGSVRQRIAAYKYRCEKLGKKCQVSDDALDDIYRFLFQSVDKDFLMFCARKEHMNIENYINAVSYSDNVVKKLRKIIDS